MHLYLLCTYTYTCTYAYYAHHICMYPYIHIYIYTYQFYTPIHTIYLQFHIWHMFCPYFLRKKMLSHLQSFLRQLAAWLHKFLMGMWRLWKEYPKSESRFQWILLDFFVTSTIRGQKYWNGQILVLILSYHTLISSSSLYICNQAPSCQYYVTIDTWFWP